jgi:hypothetical protein
MMYKQRAEAVSSISPFINEHFSRLFTQVSREKKAQREKENFQLVSCKSEKKRRLGCEFQHTQVSQHRHREEFDCAV